MTKPTTASPSPRAPQPAPENANALPATRTLEELSQTPEGRRAVAFSMAAPIRGADPRVTPAPPPEEVERAAEDEREDDP